MQLSALAAVISYFWRDVSDLLFGSLSAIGRRDFGGPTFRAAIMRERSRGVKTEPAFAAVLRLKGDPYLAILDLERCDNGRLNHFLVRAGFGGHLPSTARYPP